MNTEFQEIHLVMERIEMSAAGWHAPPGTGRDVAQAPALAVPSRPAWLVPHAGGLPRLAAVRPGKPAGSLLLEPITQRRQLRLLLVSVGKRRVRINGIPAPRFVVVKEQDCVQLDDDVLLHVTVFHRPSIGPVSADFVGKECPVCRVPFTESIIAYRCSCGAVMHCESDGAEDGLQCAQLRAGSGCPACEKPVVLMEGYSYLPEVAHE